MDTNSLETMAQRVFDELGSGHTETVYEAALEIELARMGYGPIRRQVPCPITYRGIVVGMGLIDIFIDGRVIIELKATNKLTPKDEAQVRKYVTHYWQTGMLVNFNQATGKVEVVKLGTQENQERQSPEGGDSNRPLLQEPADGKADSWRNYYIESSTEGSIRDLEVEEGCVPSSQWREIMERLRLNSRKSD